jgi:hypothetical protein
MKTKITICRLVRWMLFLHLIPNGIWFVEYFLVYYWICTEEVMSIDKRYPNLLFPAYQNIWCADALLFVQFFCVFIISHIVTRCFVSLSEHRLISDMLQLYIYIYYIQFIATLKWNELAL